MILKQLDRQEYIEFIEECDDETFSMISGALSMTLEALKRVKEQNRDYVLPFDPRKFEFKK